MDNGLIRERYLIKLNVPITLPIDFVLAHNPQLQKSR